MPGLQVAVVSSGPADAIVFAAALSAASSPIRPGTILTLQPEQTRQKLGTGWGGVLRWCLGFATEMGTSTRHAAAHRAPSRPERFHLLVNTCVRR